MIDTPSEVVAAIAIRSTTASVVVAIRTTIDTRLVAAAEATTTIAIRTAVIRSTIVTHWKIRDRAGGPNRAEVVVDTPRTISTIAVAIRLAIRNAIRTVATRIEGPTGIRLASTPTTRTTIRHRRRGAILSSTRTKCTRARTIAADRRRRIATSLRTTMAAIRRTIDG